MNPRLKTVSLLLACAVIGHSFLAAEPIREKQVTVDFVSEFANVEPGKPFTVAFVYTVDPGWHIYWINPGPFGYPPKVTWNLPEGFEAGSLEFPAPHVFSGGGAIGYGYEEAAVILAQITPPKNLKSGTEIPLAANLSWLMCDPESCVPGKVDLNLTLTVAESTGEPTSSAEAIKETRKLLPVDRDWKFFAEQSGEQATFHVVHNGAITSADDVQFFLENPKVIDIEKPSSQENSENTFSITGVMEKESLPEELAAVLVFPDHTAIRVSNTEKAAGSTASAASDASGTGAAADSGDGAAPTEFGFFAAIFGAFLAGLILNIMPCVFPVISLKILGFVEQAGHDPKKILKHGFWFTGGILSFFFLLATIIMAAGSALGWGFQLQNPAVVMGLIVILLLVALNFFGVFEIGLSLTGVGGNLTQSSGYMGSFWSGALAVVLATPCTAPFMGGAISYALANNFLVTYLVFAFLALGMASPYLLLSYRPHLLTYLPKPGAWMTVFKQVLAFPMLLVIVWLFRVLSKQINLDGMSLFLVGLILVSLAAWWFGSFAKPSNKKRTRQIALGATTVLALLTVLLISNAQDERLESPDRDVEAVIAAHQQDGRAVFVDFTAEWCLTCQANKLAIHSDKVEKAFEDNNVAFVEVDWTQQDPEILKILQKHQREGVPLYLLFDSDPEKKPIVLPNLLTDGIILDNLKKISG